MGQRERRDQEARVVRRLTVGAGAAALGLAGYFTVSAATAAPIAIAGPADATPAAMNQASAITEAERSDRVFVRRVHVPALRAPAGGVKPAPTRTAQPAATPPPAPVATPAPTPQPAATTGGTKPR